MMDRRTTVGPKVLADTATLGMEFTAPIFPGLKLLKSYAKARKLPVDDTTKELLEKEIKDTLDKNGISRRDFMKTAGAGASLVIAKMLGFGDEFTKATKVVRPTVEQTATGGVPPYFFELVKKIKKRNNKFHARFSAKQRIYKYFIFNQISQPIIEKNRAWHVRRPLNLELMKKGAKKLLGTNDYSTFRSSSCHAKSPIKTIKSIKIKSSKNKIEFQFSSQSFLQHQVRSMVGCLKYLGETKWDLKTFEKRFKSKKRTLCAPPAPPSGLFLFRVLY